MLPIGSWLACVGTLLFGMADAPRIQRPDGMPPPRTQVAAPAPPPSPAPAPAPIAEATPAPSPAPAAGPAPGPTTAADAPPAAVGPAPPPTIPPEGLDPVGEDKDGKRTAGSLYRQRDEDVAFPHRGFVADILVGPMGCVKGMCDGDRHAISTGVRTSGFIGGNIRGWVELGLGGGFGALRSKATPGTNALLMYGLDPGLLQQALNAAAAGALDVDLGGLATTRVRMQTAQAGPMARFHFVPRGRVLAWAGSGLTYNLTRNKYDTASGNVRLDFHGLAVPIQAAIGVHVHEHIAIAAQFDYLWTWYGLAVLDHPQQKQAIPVTVLQEAAQLQGVDLRGELPQFWSVGIGLRGRV